MNLFQRAAFATFLIQIFSVNGSFADETKTVRIASHGPIELSAELALPYEWAREQGGGAYSLYYDSIFYVDSDTHRFISEPIADEQIEWNLGRSNEGEDRKTTARIINKFKKNYECLMGSSYHYFHPQLSSFRSLRKHPDGSHKVSI